VGAIINSIGNVLFLLILVMKLSAGLKGAVFTLFAAYTLASFFIGYRIRIHRYFDLSARDPQMIKKMLAYSWPMVPNSMSAWIMRVSDRLVVTFFMGVAANAVYAVANKIPGLLTIAQNTFTMAWQENASVVSRDRDAGEYYSHMFETMFDLMAGFFGLLIAATPILFKLLIRGDYTEAYNQIPILFVAMFFSGMSTFLGGIYVAYKESKSVGVTTMAAAACNLIVDVVLIRRIGLYAASGSTMISYLMLFIYRSIDVQRMVKVTYKVKHMLIILAIMVVESILCFQQNLTLNLLNMVLGCIVFFAINRSFVRAVVKKGTAYLNKKRRGC
jgi:O-antigen/teichoic acid export membrane protein